MKRPFHAILILLTLSALNVLHAQDAKPTPIPEPLCIRMVPLGITMVLGTLKEVEATEDVKMSIVMMAGFFPEKFADESEKMVKIAGAERKDQLVMLEDVTESVRAKTPNGDKWTVDFGRRWGKTYGEGIKLGTTELKGDPKAFLESLHELGALLEMCKKDVPPEILPKLKKIVDTYPKEEKYSIGVVLGSFVSASIELIDYLDSLERVAATGH